jgi:hypothetical protein
MMPMTPQAYAITLPRRRRFSILPPTIGAMSVSRTPDAHLHYADSFATFSLSAAILITAA